MYCGNSISYEIELDLEKSRFAKIHTDLNVADPLTKALTQSKHDGHTRAMGIRYL